MVICLCSFIFLSVDSCNSSREEIDREEAERINGIMSTIEKTLEADTISEEALMAFQKKAIGKLQEFGDYLSVYADPSLDSQLRQNTGLILKNLFVSDETFASVNKKAFSQTPMNSLNSILEELDNMKKDKVIFSIDSIQMTNSFEMFNDSIYTGNMEYLETIGSIMEGDTNVIRRSFKQCDVYIVKTTKAYEGHRQKAWKVFLGILN